MEQSFWHDKWERMETGFHLNEVNKALLKYWPDMALEKGQTVLLPLCGKTLDLIWLRSEGYSVVGIELSDIALDSLAQNIQHELGIKLQKSITDNGDTTLYCGEGVLLIAGDFFTVTHDFLQAQTGQVISAVYDRAALVALPDAMRARYADHLIELTQCAPQLLITLDYDQDRHDGPPFAVSDQEVEDHYQTRYSVSRIDERELIDQEPRFKAQGLESFKQRVYLLK